MTNLFAPFGLRAVVLKAARTFLPLSLLAAVFFLFNINAQVERRIEIMGLKEANLLSTEAEYIRNEMNGAKTDLAFLATSRNLMDYLGNEDQGVLEDWRQFSSQMEKYDQIRFIDSSGMERIRIDYNHGSPEIVPPNRLQNKSKRYFFVDAMKLDKGQTYISPFDLNVEKGEIEVPYKPMIRLATPVFNKGGIKRGIVVMNYLGMNIKKRLNEYNRNSSGNLFLLNPDGYWLHSAESRDEWGFMLGSSDTFKLRQPIVWSRMNEESAGRMFASDSYFTWLKVYPAGPETISNINQSKVDDTAAGKIAKGEYYWWIASHTTKDQLAVERNRVLAGQIYPAIFTLGVTFILAMILAVADLKRGEAEKALKVSEAHYRLLAENVADVIWTADLPLRCFNYVSPSIKHLLGYSPEETSHMCFEGLLPPHSRERTLGHLKKELQSLADDAYATQKTMEMEFLRKDGASLWAEIKTTIVKDDSGRPALALGVIRDITERKRMEAALKEMSETDPLTKLFNRRRLMEALVTERELARRHGRPLSIIMFDIDHFKKVNDVHGHDAGDLVLKETARVVGSVLRTGDLFARYGGEEFFIMAPETNLEGAVALAEKARQQMDQHSFATAGHVTISIGVSTFTDNDNMDDAIKRADNALYAAKKGGRNRVEYAEAQA